MLKCEMEVSQNRFLDVSWHTIPALYSQKKAEQK